MFGFLRFLSGIVVGMVLGFVFTLSAMHYHFLRTENSIAVVAKRHPALASTYMDIRDWTAADWAEHPDLVYTLFKNDRQDLLPTVDGQIATLKRLIDK